MKRIGKMWKFHPILPAAMFIIAAAILIQWRAQAALPPPAARSLQMRLVPVPPHANTPSGGLSHIQVNDSFGARNMLRTADRLMTSGHLTQAIRTFQHIAEKYSANVIRQTNGTYMSVRKYVWSRLLSMNAVQHGLYDQIYGLQAQQAIQQARQTHSLSHITSVCRRYFATSAAADGLQYVAEREFERGGFARAAAIWRQLLTHPALIAQRPLLLHNAAIAAWLAGQRDQARKLLQQLSTSAPRATGVIAGKMGSLLADARQALQTPSPFHHIVHSGTWATFQGTFQRNAVAIRGTLPAAILWTKPLHTFAARHNSGPAFMQYQNTMRQFLPAFGLTMDPVTGKLSGDVQFSFPTCRNGILYLNLLDQIKAVDINSGYTLWKYPRDPLPPGSTTGSASTLISHLDHYSCTLANNRVYTIVTRPMANIRQFNGQIGFIGPYGMASGESEIVCLDQRSGQLQWKVACQNLLPGKFGRSIWPTCIPLAGRRAVFLLVMATQPGTGMNELNLVRLRASTGQVQWTRYLCTIAGPAYGISPFNSVSMIPAMADRTLYISTGLGADMAVDIDSGQVAWLRLNKMAYTAMTGMQYGIARRTLPWQINSPVVAGSRVITMDNGLQDAATLHIYNRRTGAKLLSLSGPSLHHADMLLGVIHGNILLLGNRLWAVNIKTGKPSWFSATIRTFGQLTGRPFLTQHDVYLPLNTGLLLVHTADGHTNTLARWPAGISEPSGNLLVTAHEVIVVNDHLTAGYARWADALAYLNGQIKAHPNRPDTYLTLSEVAFRSGHDKLARNMLTRAVALANSRMPTSTTATDRIFEVCMSFADAAMKHTPGNSKALFYLQKAGIIARTPAQQVRWRMTMANCYIHQSHAAKAITLLEEILARPDLRSAPVTYQGVTLASAMAAREMIQTHVIGKFGLQAYAPWETQARQLLTNAIQTDLTAPLERIILEYPNSQAALNAARRLALHFSKTRHWAKAYDMLLWAHSGRNATPSEQAWQLAHRCSVLVHLRHRNQALVLARRGAARFADYQWTAGTTWTFGRYAAYIQKTAPTGSLHQRAQLRAKPESRLIVSAAITGDLLEPLEHSPRYNRYDLFLVGKASQNDYLISAHPITSIKPLWHYRIMNTSRAMLVGYWKTLAILATSNHVLALHTRTGKLAWKFKVHPEKTKSPASVTAPPIQRGNVIVMGNGMIIQNGTLLAHVVSPKITAQWRKTFINHTLGTTITYSLIKLVRGGLVVARRGDLMLYNPATGRPRWAHPVIPWHHQPVYLIKQTPRYITVVTHLPMDRAVLISRRTGQIVGVLPLNAQARFFWIKTDPAGRIFLCGQHGAAMYDPAISMSAPVWIRTGLHDPFPTAASLSVDGLITPTATGMACLDFSSGNMRWNQPALTAGLSANGDTWMRTALNGNTLVMLTPQDLMAIFTRTGKIAWKAEFVSQTRPPLTAAEIGEPDIAAMASGPIETSAHVMHLYLIDQRDRQGRLDNGSIVLDQQLTRSKNDAAAPDIQSWLIVNGGILFEINGVVFYCHT